jgi:hypothetical protein
MTTLTMRMIKGNFVVTGPDVEPVKFKSRREARDWCAKHHPGSPIEDRPGRASGPRSSGQKPSGQVERFGAEWGFFLPSAAAGSRVQTLIFILN